MKFKSSEQLIARVVKTLHSFQSSGLLDEGDFYRWIKEVIGELNIPSFSPVHKIIKLDGNKLLIPDDVNQLWAIYRWEEEDRLHDPVKHYQGQTRWLVQEDQCLNKKCVDKCQSLYEEGDVMVSKWFIEDQHVEKRFTHKTPIKLVNYTVDRCISSSPIKTNNSTLKANMDANYFYFNFEDGWVYLQYYSFVVDEDGLPMVPDVVEAESAIEKYIIYRFFQELYYNTTIDALQRMQYAQQEYQRAFDKARTYCKFPTFKELMSISEKNKGRFKMFELAPVR